ncbi:hypothetical protein FNF29_07721 [Cafeteria roenbergensis]|uniref:WW domain-containing protein n=1 Tax=Cafeteria roenbergensis TaxID=33653 RepID=A0A5A8C2N5_CAFRO|nr:hypothetical protein FNF29_07721 [Cafeteria roenbergensis]|eukprot:KAA0146917.1 hypothetical protein FNF29_07721 [Cafeteria roenbergensis]
MRQAVLAQCQQLGVSPDESEDVLVLVVESLLADPLPGWQEERDSATGSAYWYNIETGESTWKNPVDEAYAERIQQLRARQSAAASAAGGGAAGSAQAGGSGASAWTDAAVAAGSAGGRGGGAFGSHASSGGTSGRILTPAEMLASPIHRPAVEDVAAVLGIDPVSDGEFLIIAAECLAAGQTLPPGWQTAFDEQQQHDYWWNDVTGESHQRRSH